MPLEASEGKCWLCGGLGEIEVTCSVCEGTGRVGRYQCETCYGKKKFKITCRDCGGTGKRKKVS